MRYNNYSIYVVIDSKKKATLIEVRENKTFDNVNRNTINPGDVNRSIAVMILLRPDRILRQKDRIVHVA